MGSAQVYLGKVGELTLKGSNVHLFEKQLVHNVKTALEDFDIRVSIKAGRLYVFSAPDKKTTTAVEYVLNHLLGITAWAKVRTVEKNISAIKDAVTDLCKKARTDGATSFKIEARREDKTFPLTSYQICAEAAGDVFDNTILAVNVHNPDVTIYVEVRDECYVYTRNHKTYRGLPVGVSGRGVLLLSGGLDSPVAGFRMISRGMKIECAYFHSYPYTSREAQQKVEELAQKLADYGIETHLNVISFTKVQTHIKKTSPEAYSTLLLRLCMMKAANLLVDRIHADCLITGESLGQVASQTIANLAVTESFARYPLVRPLIGLDKEDIIDTAQKIGTYNTSILPYEDCCVLFSPRHPVLRASVPEATELFNAMHIDPLIQEAFDTREVIRYTLKDSVSKLKI